MLLLTLFSIFTRCLGFIFKIYLTKIMSTTELGIYNLTLSIYMVIITLVGASIPLTISKITAHNKTNSIETETKYSVTSSLIMTTLFSIFLSILLVISKPLISLIIGNNLGYTIILTLIPSILFTALYSQIRGYLWGIENYFAVSIVELVEQILRIAFCIIFSLTGWIKSPILSVGISLSIACGISCLYGFVLYFKNNGRFKFKNGYCKNIIKSTLPLTLVRLCGSLLQPLIAIIIPLKLCALGMSKDLALSELGVIMGMTMPLLSIPSTIIGALCMILIPRINMSKENSEKQTQINNYIKFTITCSYIFIPVFICLSLSICNYVYGNLSAGIYMQHCCWIIIPLGLSQITTSILNALNQENKTFLYYLLSCIVLLLLVIVLPKFCGIKSMLIASGISSIILVVLNLVKLFKVIKLKFNIITTLLLHSFLCVPVIILNNFCYNIFINSIGTFFSIALTGIISVISYISLLFVFGIFDIKMVKNYVVNYLKQKTTSQ